MDASWTRVCDAQSGRAFFYCAATGDTRWHAPTATAAPAPPLVVDASGHWCAPSTPPQPQPPQEPQPQPPPRVPHVVPLPPPRTHGLYVLVRATLPGAPADATVHAALWRGPQRLTAPAVLRRDAAGRALGVLGPLGAPPGRHTVLRVAHHRADGTPCALAAVALTAAPSARARAPSVLAPTPPLPDQPEHEQTQQQRQQEQEQQDQEKRHAMVLDAAACPVGAVGTRCGDAGVWLEAALVARVPEGFAGCAQGRALALARTELLAARNDLHVAVDLAAFAQNARSVEGFALPRAYDVCAHAVCRGRAAGAPAVVARHRADTPDALAAAASLAHIALDPAVAADPALCVVLDFVALEDEGEGKEGNTTRRASFAWAYAKLAGVGARARSDVQVYCGAPVVVADDAGALVPVVPALTPPDVLARAPADRPRAAARCLADSSSLVGLAVTTVPLTIYIASAARALVADGPECCCSDVAALVHALRQAAAEDTEEHVAEALERLGRCVEQLHITESPEGLAHLAAGLGTLPVGVAARLLDTALSALEQPAREDWAQLCVVASALAQRLCDEADADADAAAAATRLLAVLCSSQSPIQVVAALWACAELLPRVLCRVPSAMRDTQLTALVQMACAPDVAAAPGVADALAQLVLALCRECPAESSLLVALYAETALPVLTRAVRAGTLAVPCFRAAACAVFEACTDVPVSAVPALAAAAALVGELADAQDVACAQGLLAFWAGVARDPARLHTALVDGVGTVARTGALLAKHAALWRALLAHVVLCAQNTGSSSSSSSSSISGERDAVAGALAHTALALVAAAVAGQDGLWCTALAGGAAPHSALVALVAAVLDPACGARLDPPCAGRLLACAAQLATALVRAAVPLAPATCAPVAAALLRALAAAADPARRTRALDALTALLLAEWRATGAAAGLLAGTGAWLAGALVAHDASASAPAPAHDASAPALTPTRTARAFCAHVQETLATHVDPASRATAAVLRLAGRVAAHVRAVCTALGCAATMRLASPDVWQALLAGVLRGLGGAEGTGPADVAALTAAALVAAQRGAALAEAAGEHETAAHLLLAQHELAWALAAHRPAVAVHVLPRPEAVLCGALQALVRAGACADAQRLVQRLVRAGVLAPARAAGLAQWLGEQGAPMPAAHYLLRFDGHQLPPDVDGCTFVARAAPGTTLARLVARLRRRLGSDLVVATGAGTQSPVLRPAKFVHVTRAWAGAEDDGDEECGGDDDAAPTTAFTAFLPMLCAPCNSSRSKNGPQQDQQQKQQQKRQSTLMRHTSETAAVLLLKTRAASMDTSDTHAPDARPAGTPSSPSTAAEASDEDDYEDNDDEYILDGVTARVPTEVHASLGARGAPPPPVVRAAVVVEHALPGPLVLARVVRCACTAVARVDACAVWVARQSARLLRLCAALRAAAGPTHSSLAAASTRCPACAERLRTGQVAAVEQRLPPVPATPPTASPAALDTRGAGGEADSDAFVAAVREAAQDGTRRTLANPGVALDVLRAVLADVLADGCEDALLGLRACAVLVAREAARRHTLHDAVEAHLRRQHIRRQREHAAALPRPDWGTLRLVCPPRVAQLRADLARLGSVVGYALVLADGLSKHALTDLLAEHLRWEETLAGVFRTLP